MTQSATIDAPPPAAPTPAAAPPTPPAGPWSLPDGGPRLIANRGPLLEALKALAPLVNARTPRAALNCYRVAAGPDGVTVEASNMEQSGRAALTQTQVERPGVYLIPAAGLRDIVAASGGDTVTLDCGGGRCEVKAPDGRWRVNAVDPATWPGSAEPWPKEIASVCGPGLRRILAQALPSVSTVAGRYAFSGLLLTAERGDLVAVATDGRRLAYSAVPFAGKAPKAFPSSILPAAAVKALIPALPDEGDVGVWASAGDRETPAGVCFYLPDGLAFRTNVIEGEFPPYADVIPQYGDGDPTLKADRAALLAALDRAALVIPPESLRAKPDDKSAVSTSAMTFRLTKDGLVLSARDPNLGESETTLAGGTFTGPDLVIGFNAGFVRDAVSACEGPAVTLRFGRPNQCVLVEDGGTPARFVVMPVNLK